ncbi:DUF6414 family protein [Heyndrickxia coagulans]
MKKIVYFDEESALDWLDQENNGRMEQINKEIIKKGKTIISEAEINAEAGIGYFFNVLKFRGKGRTKGDYAREGSSVIEKTITNTILTNFLQSVSSSENENDRKMEYLQQYQLSLLEDSFTFYKTITPIFKLLPQQISIDDNSLKEMNIDSIDISNFDEVIDSLKGYFEFKAFNPLNGNRKVVRFNLNSLRNNYRLTDFLSMDLVMYGIKVGESQIEEFDINSVFREGATKQVQSDGISLRDFIDRPDESIEHNLLEVIDIILAGIE